GGLEDKPGRANLRHHYRSTCRSGRDTTDQRAARTRCIRPGTQTTDATSAPYAHQAVSHHFGLHTEGASLLPTRTRQERGPAHCSSATIHWSLQGDRAQSP